jgi:hypothetical protein
MPKLRWDSTATNPFLSADSTVRITYDGHNFGPVYLKDVGMRNQLGGGRGIYVHGQDRYIHHDGTTVLLKTSDVLQSINSGVIGDMLDKSAFHVYFGGSFA